jgi:HAD superfamily hydrolase (TIGR01509 family)
MSGLHRLRAVVFDMDGVLIDSEPLIRRAAQRAGEIFGHTLSDSLYADLIGLPGAQVEAALVAAFGADFPLPEYRRCFERLYREDVAANGIRSKPGVPQLLSALRANDVPVAVATSTRSGHAQAALESAGLLDYLPVCITGDQVNAGKPEPEIFLRAATSLSIDARECIAIEDSEVGARAAVSAGMWTLMVPDLKQPSAELARMVREILPSMPHAARRVITLLNLEETP